MTATEDQLLNGMSPSTSVPSHQNGSAANGLESGPTPNYTNGNIQLRKDMSTLQPVHIKIVNDKLLDAHQPRYQEDSLERFCPCEYFQLFLYLF